MQSSYPQQKNQKHPRLDLPFSRRRVDPGTWAYDHRGAIVVTVVAYLLFAVAFVTADIVISKKSAQNEILIDLTNLDELQKELERAQELNRMLNEQRNSEPVSNRISNENALDERLEDHRTDAKSIYAEAEEVQQRVRSNAAEYAVGLEREREILNKHYEGEEMIQNEKVRGNVTVSYSLSSPVRRAVRMPVPAYMCEGGGEVVVDIVVNNSGEVIDCKINDALSERNDCLRDAALEKAGSSVFNADPSAPARHRGTISYLFIAQ